MKALAVVCLADTVYSHSHGIRAISRAAAEEELGAELETTIPRSLKNSYWPHRYIAAEYPYE
jgi:hypothetical protein